MAGSKSASSPLSGPTDNAVSLQGARITILGIGNLLLKDEGVGIHLVQRLSEKLNDPCVTIIDGGTTPDLFSLLNDDIDKLIIIDAAVAGDKPGTIYRFQADDLAAGSATPVSLHEMGLVDNLKLMDIFGNRPREITIFGVEPQVIKCGVELSPEVEEKIPRLIELVLDEIEQTKTPMEVAR